MMKIPKRFSPAYEALAQTRKILFNCRKRRVRELTMFEKNYLDHLISDVNYRLDLLTEIYGEQDDE